MQALQDLDAVVLWVDVAKDALVDQGWREGGVLDLGDALEVGGLGGEDRDHVERARSKRAQGFGAKAQARTRARTEERVGAGAHCRVPQAPHEVARAGESADASESTLTTS